MGVQSPPFLQDLTRAAVVPRVTQPSLKAGLTTELIVNPVRCSMAFVSNSVLWLCHKSCYLFVTMDGVGTLSQTVQLDGGGLATVLEEQQWGRSRVALMALTLARSNPVQ